MDFNIITGSPSWYVLLCVLSGALAAMILYYRERKSEFPLWLKWLLGINRFVIVSLLAFLLLSPLLKLLDRYTEKPIIVFAQDNSASLLLNEDSSYYQNEYIRQLNAVVEELAEDYELSLFTFGEEVSAVPGKGFDSLSYSDKQTDMSSIFEMMDVRFANRNIGALVIAGDGIYNRGINPAYQYSSLQYPVYTLALGDTSIRRDAFLKRVLYNRIAFQGNDFPVEVILNANRLKGSTLTLGLSEGGAVMSREQVPVTADNFSKTMRLNVHAGEAGMHHYVLWVSSNRDEITRENNRYDLFVDVLQSKQKVLILANSPHPDISALKEAIGSNRNYEVEDMMLDDFNSPLQEYSLIILHQLPAASAPSPGMMSRVNRAGVPVLYVLGPQTELQAFNRQKTGMLIKPYNRSGMTEALPVSGEGFTLFTLSTAVQDLIPLLPPLNVPFAEYSAINASGVLLHQQLGSVESTAPLWMLDRGRERKLGVICGTGLWRWRMKSWLETGSHDGFNELVNKSVQFLAVKEDKRRFRVSTTENIPENVAAAFKAELYNESYEPVNEPDVSMEIGDDSGNKYDFIFNKTDNAYTLDAGNFPVGTYTYKATVRLGEDVFTDGGGFTISPVVAEQIALRAEHELLRELATENGGSMLDVNELSTLPQLLKERSDVKPLIHSEKKYIAFIDIWWMLIIIIALLGMEWFLRKWSGSY